MTQASPPLLTVRPLTGNIGALIEGFDISEPLPDAIREEILQAFLDHKVLVLKGQDKASAADLLDFCRTFGAPEEAPHPQHAAYPGIPGVKVLRSDAGNEDEDRDSSWHTDGSQRASGVRQWVSILRAIDVPAYGRDTAFVDMESVFARLSETLRGFLTGLQANHSWGWTNPGVPPVQQEVAPVDKRTGRRTLYVSPFYTTDIIGLRKDESDLLLKFLLSKIHRLENQLRVAWEPGTIVVWDNARTLHYPVMDRAYPRVMHRVMTLLPDEGIPWKLSERQLQAA